jgi:hypothetical protein
MNNCVYYFSLRGEGLAKVDGSCLGWGDHFFIIYAFYKNYLFELRYYLLAD